MRIGKKVAIVTPRHEHYRHVIRVMQIYNADVDFFHVASIHAARAVIFDLAIEYCVELWGREFRGYDELQDRFKRYKTEVRRIDEIREPFILFPNSNQMSLPVCQCLERMKAGDKNVVMCGQPCPLQLQYLRDKPAKPQQPPINTDKHR
jgi:hypothetical protein